MSGRNVCFRMKSRTKVMRKKSTDAKKKMKHKVEGRDGVERKRGVRMERRVEVWKMAFAEPIGRRETSVSRL